MRALMYLLSALVVMGLAFWAYRENYRTQAQIDEMQRVQNEIARLREDIGVLRAEWAYLNRPERLRDLVDINFDRLRLGPVQASQFGAPRNVDYPDPAAIKPVETAAGGPGTVPPVPSNNRGAPLPRPLRTEGGGGGAGSASSEPATSEPAAEAAIADDADAPADTAITDAPDPEEQSQ